MIPTNAEQSLATDGAIACFSSSLLISARNADRAPQLKAIVRRLGFQGVSYMQRANSMKQSLSILCLLLVTINLAKAQDRSLTGILTTHKAESIPQRKEQTELEQLNIKLLKLYREGKYNDATPLAEKVLEIIGKTSPVTDDVAVILFNVAELLQATNDFSKAGPLYERVMQMWDKDKTPINDEMALNLGRYACLKRKTNRPDDAQRLERRAYGISVGGANDKIESTAVPPYKKVKNGRVIDLPQPSHRGLPGRVVVRIVIDESARVILACAVEGNPRLAPLAEQAAYRARFTPTSVNDKPVKISGVINYNFH